MHYNDFCQRVVGAVLARSYLGSQKDLAHKVEDGGVTFATLQCRASLDTTQIRCS
jgi:hypothetical protein